MLQIIDIYEHDYRISKKNAQLQYEICLFCTNMNSISHCIRIIDYKPSFLVELESIEEKSTIEDEIARHLKQFKTYKHYLSCIDFILVSKQVLQEYKEHETKMLQIFFPTLQLYYKIKNFLRRSTSYILCNIDISPSLQFCHSKNIETSGWIKIAKSSNKKTFSTCEIELSASKNDICSLPNVDQISPIKIASFDIETSTQSKDKYPDFRNKDDSIIQIGTTIEKFGDSSYLYKYIVTLGDCASTEMQDVELETCNTEIELINAWTEFIQRMDPDIIIGYNIFGYDYEYIFERALYLKTLKSICNLTRVYNYLNLRQIKSIEKYNFTNEIPDNASYTLSKIYKKTNTGNFGRSDNFKIIRIIGRVNLDLLTYVRKNGDKLSSYKLDAVSKHYGLDKGKDNVSYKEIFRIYKNGTIEEKQTVALYCIQDCYLCNELVRKLNVIPNCIGMASTCYIPLNYLFIRGQGIKIYSLLLKECSELNFAIESNNREKSISRYKGATVLSANKDFHQYPVSVLDFASLYPSCMISHNLCISTKLSLAKIKSLNLKPEEYRVIEWYEIINAIDLLKILKKFGSRKLARFVSTFNIRASEIKPMDFSNFMLTMCNEKNTVFWDFFELEINQLSINRVNNSNVIKFHQKHYYLTQEKFEGIIPKVLRKLLNKRKATKLLKKKYETKNQFLSKIYDALQLSYKITANSVYGQLGATFNSFGNIDVAASVTSMGRQLLKFAQDTILDKFHNSKAIYGDSVTGDTPILIKTENGKINIIEIQYLEQFGAISKIKKMTQVLNQKNKEHFFVLKGVEIWSSGGWTKIIKFIRHKVKKNIYRINTHLGSVDVTEDHSLLTRKLKKISPKKCKIGTKLYHSYLNFQNCSLNYHNLTSFELEQIPLYVNKILHLKYTYHEKKYFLYGVFFGIGSSISPDCWALSHENPNVINKLQRLLQNVYPDVLFRFKKKKKSLKYELHALNKRKELHDEHKQFYNKLNNKIAPIDIFNTTKWIQKWFFMGLFFTKAKVLKNKNQTPILGINNKLIYKISKHSKVSNAHIYFILKSLNIHCIIYQKWILFCTKNEQIFYDKKYRSSLGKIISIELLNNKKSEYVYDVETEDHTFQAGIGEMIVHNTDSVFIKFELKNHIDKCPNHIDNIENVVNNFCNFYSIDTIKNIYYDLKKSPQLSIKLIKPIKPIKLEYNYQFCSFDFDSMNKENIPNIPCSFDFDSMNKENIPNISNIPNTPNKIYVACKCPKLNNYLDKKSLQQSMELAKNAEKYITYLLPCSKSNSENGVHKLEYEKTYQPFILFSKKKYVGKLNGGEINSKGIVLSRRDNCKLLKNIYNKCLKCILDGNMDDALKELDIFLKQLNMFDIENFIITKKLRDPKLYKSTTQSHVMLAKRVAERNPGNAFQINERIPYCFIENTKSKSSLQHEKVETPTYIKENDLKLDYSYYIENQLHNPISQLFEIIHLSQKSKKIFQAHVNFYKNKKNKQSFFKIDKNGKINLNF